jgi:hypothetical protein
MSEMIERCAKAIVDSYNEGPGLRSDWEFLSEWQRDFARNQARAVLAAMREPTEEMLAPYEDAMTEWWGNAEEMAENVWHEMIDAALSEKTQAPSSSA